MSVNLKFGKAADGDNIPKTAMVDENSLSVMNKMIRNASAVTVFAVAALVGHGVYTGHVDPTQIAIKTNAAGFAKATPPGGLRATGDETVSYAPNLEGLFNHGGDMPAIKPPAMG